MIVQNLLVCKLIKIYHSVFWLWDMGAYSGKAKVQQKKIKRESPKTPKEREKEKNMVEYFIRVSAHSSPEKFCRICTL